MVGHESRQRSAQEIAGDMVSSNEKHTRPRGITRIAEGLGPGSCRGRSEKTPVGTKLAKFRLGTKPVEQEAEPELVKDEKEEQEFRAEGKRNISHDCDRQ